MSYFLIFLAVAVGGAVALYVVGLNRSSAAADGSALADSLADPVANLPPVLLPDVPRPEDVDRLRFSLGLRGYRMDQVDEVLDLLRDQLALRDARITELEETLSRDARAAVGSDQMQARPE
ncbi:DivIVA domain-containing protein [Paenarthrobacter sp. Z7-10]|uniref:DivIVA domain-containing protein n=1 Tax=Paenarthrobacter sp. Z7-10 TaxID=2787635 RepID=UPI0022A9D0B8|nr:DivIVA domain-containing protein [Paenarthrobacter sp. Z7-10]MCZ2404003.1 DivIVA domain-containing protein [Paenarthrobacter sp. Z7-10]